MIPYTIWLYTLKWFLRRSVCMYFPQDVLFNCDKYDELRKAHFHKIKSLLCPNVNSNSFKNELNTYLVELFLQGSDDLSMDDNIVIFQCVYEFIEHSNIFL